MDKITHEMRLSQWTPIVRSCRSSGMSIKTWCNENNVNEGQFYYWQRRIREDMYNTIDTTEPKRQLIFAQLQAPTISSRSKSDFTVDMVIRIGNNVLELTNTTSEELLSKVLRVISHVE